ncbi:MAG: CDP-glucose 4,6-dehydratase [Blastochloris sp.]|nr:CDP-glucose 4,6-dehydratase [Blastochloris sp.]
MSPFFDNPTSALDRLTQTFMGKKVCVTGHTGFKGSWLCEWLLLMGAEVSGFSLPEASTNLDLFSQLKLSSRLEDVRGDIRNPVQVADWLIGSEPDFVFNLAAQPLVRLSYKVPVLTWETNVLGTIHVMEGLRQLSKPCAAVMVTTDKVYENREWLHGYREEDPLGGHDPYSSSKVGAEIAIASWRQSFFKKHPVSLASVRAGNVIGGGDWAEDRIVPDCIKSLMRGESIPVRNKISTRPWQHVLEPLSGYLLLASMMSSTLDSPPATSLYSSAFNFGPRLESNRTVAELVNEVLKHWPGQWVDQSDPNAPHEAGKLNLATDKAFHVLGWKPRWNFETTVAKTVEWYRLRDQGLDVAVLTQNQIKEYNHL